MKVIDVIQYWDCKNTKDMRYEMLNNITQDTSESYVLDFTNSAVKSPFTLSNLMCSGLVSLLNKTNVVFKVTHEDGQLLSLCFTLYNIPNLSERVKVAPVTTVYKQSYVPSAPCEVIGNELVIDFKGARELDDVIMSSITSAISSNSSYIINGVVSVIRIRINVSGAPAQTKVALWKMIKCLETKTYKQYGLKVVLDFGDMRSAGPTKLDILEMLNYTHLDYNLVQKIKYWQKIPTGLVGVYQHYTLASNAGSTAVKQYYRDIEDITLSSYAVYRGILINSEEPVKSCLVFDLLNAGREADRCMPVDDYRARFNTTQRPHLQYERVIIPVGVVGYDYAFLGVPNRNASVKSMSRPSTASLVGADVARTDFLQNYRGVAHFKRCDPKSYEPTVVDGEWVNVSDAAYAEKLLESYRDGVYPIYNRDELRKDIEEAEGC